MTDPTVMWIPRNLTLKVIKETAHAMNFWETLKTTLFLNIAVRWCRYVPALWPDTASHDLNSGGRDFFSPSW